MNLLKELDPASKRVIVRCDFDVPTEDGKITEDIRIRHNLATLKFIRERAGKLLLISHLGRPKGPDPRLSLHTVLPLLEELLGEKVVFQEDLQKQPQGEIVLLENLRFWPEEEANEPVFAAKIASLGDAYVQECFSAAHRTHASIVGVAKLLPNYLGLNLAKEIDELNKVLKSSDHPITALIGGAKIETKLPAITNLAKVTDQVLVGGKLMFEVKDTTLPANVLVAKDAIEGKDIGPETIKVFGEIIAKSKLVVWNGPMGLFEEERYAFGTKGVAQAVAESPAYSVVGGGDTISALDALGLLEEIDFVSMGGGAMLDFLAGKRLPGLEILGVYA